MWHFVTAPGNEHTNRTRKREGRSCNHRGRLLWMLKPLPAMTHPSEKGNMGTPESVWPGKKEPLPLGLHQATGSPLPPPATCSPPRPQSLPHVHRARAHSSRPPRMSQLTPIIPVSQDSAPCSLPTLSPLGKKFSGRPPFRGLITGVYPSPTRGGSRGDSCPVRETQQAARDSRRATPAARNLSTRSRMTTHRHGASSPG